MLANYVIVGNWFWGPDRQRERGGRRSPGHWHDEPATAMTALLTRADALQLTVEGKQIVEVILNGAQP